MEFLLNILAVTAFLSATIAFSEGLRMLSGDPDVEFILKKPDTMYDDFQEPIDKIMKEVTTKIPKFDSSISHCGDEPETDQNCPSNSQIIQPYAVKTNSSTKLIVQSKYYEQKFTITQCINHYSRNVGDGSQCLDNIIRTDNPLYQAKCETLRGEIIVYLYDIGTKELQRVNMFIDVCCSCTMTTKEDDGLYDENSFEFED